MDRLTLNSEHRYSELEHSYDAAILADLLQAELTRHNALEWTTTATEIWCEVTSPNHHPRSHGWKLHVAATPLSAPVVLARVADVLIAEGCSFKFARDLRQVAQLVDGRCERSSGGKFVTVYPADQEQFRRLAQALHVATVDLAGPRILSDRPFRPGSLVHYRYGEFSGEPVFTDNGVFETRVYDPDGHRFTDERKAWFCPPAWAPSAFADDPPSVTEADSVLLVGRFRVARAIRQANKGGVYRAVDETTGSDVVIKQARAHVGARLNGTDVRDELRREAAMLDHLRPLGVAPRKVALFEQQGDLFLAEELIDGEPMDVWANRHREEAGLLVERLIGSVQQVHDAGFVLCDLKPQNVMVGPDRQLRLVDVEHVVRIGDGCRAATEGFAAPEVLSARWSSNALAASPTLDCYSLGATIFHNLTGLDGRWLSGQERVLDAIAATYPGLTEHADVVEGLTRSDPRTRWTLAMAGRSRQKQVSPARAGRRLAGSAVALLRNPILDSFLDDGIVELREHMTPENRYLWRRSWAYDKHNDPCAAWPGAAGVLAVLTRSARATNSDRHMETVRDAAAWIEKRLDTSVPRLLPGLCFGRAGTAWALFDAAELLHDQGLRDRAVGLAKALPTEAVRFDVTHGLAGAGLLHVYLWQQTGDEAVRQRALGYAGSLLDTPALAAESGTPLGFGHGLAGVGAFLVAAAEITDSSDAERFTEAAHVIGHIIVSAAGVTEGRATWPLDVDGRRGIETFWCNGPSGIGEFLLRLSARTGDDRFLAHAEQAAETVVADPWRHPVGACCGLAGAGQFLMDMAQQSGDRRYRRYAHHIAGVILAQRTKHGRLAIADPGRGDDYGHGAAGILDFLLRLRDDAARPWLPAPLAARPENRPGASRAAAAAIATRVGR
ncbi:MAG: class IV lanthionine synthetase LanL [Labedaea sp.]